MKKILIIAYYYPPQNNGGIQRILNFRKYLPSYGYSVDVITTNSYGVTDDEAGVIRVPDKGYDTSHCANKLIAFPYKVYRSMIVKMGLVDGWFYAWEKEIEKNIDRYVDLKKYDYIMASYPPVATLRIGLMIAHKTNIPLIVDYRDGLMFEPFEQMLKKGRRYLNRMYELEKELSETAILQVTVSDEMKRYYSDKYNKLTVMIPNGYDSEEKLHGDAIELPSGINIVYTGILDSGRMEYSLDILDRLIRNNPDINFVFIGTSIKKNKWVYKYDNVVLHKKVDRSVSVLTQRRADALLLITDDSPGGTTGKLYEYLFSLRPIIHIGAHDNNAGRIIKNTDSGETFSPNEYEEAQSFIDKLRMHGLREYKHDNIDQYSRRYECKELARIIDDLNYKQ